MEGDHTSWPEKNYIVHVGAPYIRVGGTILYLSHIRYGGTIRVIQDMNTLHIDSYKVPAVDPNHSYMWGGEDGVPLHPRTGSFNSSTIFLYND